MSRTQPAAALEGPDLAAATDEQVVTQALVGHQLAAREIVRRYQRPVFNLIVRMVQDAGTAEDLAQETFVKVFRSLQTFDVRLRFAAWILKIAHNTTLDYLRRHRPHLVPLDAPFQGGEGTLADQLADSRRRVTRAIGGAPATEGGAGRGDRSPQARYRRVLVLRYQEDLDYAEIAEITGTPLGTVKTFLHRARQALACELRKTGWGPGGAETSGREST